MKLKKNVVENHSSKQTNKNIFTLNQPFIFVLFLKQDAKIR